MGLCEKGKERLKDNVENIAEPEDQEQEEGINMTPHHQEMVLNRA